MDTQGWVSFSGGFFMGEVWEKSNSMFFCSRKNDMFFCWIWYDLIFHDVDLMDNWCSVFHIQCISCEEHLIFHFFFTWTSQDVMIWNGFPQKPLQPSSTLQVWSSSQNFNNSHALERMSVQLLDWSSRFLEVIRLRRFAIIFGMEIFSFASQVIRPSSWMRSTTCLNSKWNPTTAP